MVRALDKADAFKRSIISGAICHFNAYPLSVCVGWVTSCLWWLDTQPCVKARRRRYIVEWTLKLIRRTNKWCRDFDSLMTTQLCLNEQKVASSSYVESWGSVGIWDLGTCVYGNIVENQFKILCNFLSWYRHQATNHVRCVFPQRDS